MKSHGALPLKRRVELLHSFYDALKRNEDGLLQAIKEDLNKSDQEGYMCELALVYSEIKYMLKHAIKAAKPHRVGMTLASFPSGGATIRSPYGTVLIVSPWNYPYLLTFQPLVGAIAMGNRAIVKPSELSPNCSLMIKKVVEEAFKEDEVKVFLGEREVSSALFALPFDLLFFTGSTKVGRIAYMEAAKHLTPCVLELGGKSPCLVLDDADLELTAKRICMGKVINAGQTCVAPDYVLLPKGKVDEFVSIFKKMKQEMVPGGELNSPFYAKIISEGHLKRLQGLIEGEQLCFGGKVDSGRMEITLLKANGESKSMQEEIFGPILPIIEYESLDEALQFIASRPRPLAFYVFSRSKRRALRIMEQVDFGGGAVNHCIMHLTNHHLPFGGVGDSGIGRYHGQASIEAFSYQKGVLVSGKMDNSLRYPPYTHKKFLKVKGLLK